MLNSAQKAAALSWLLFKARHGQMGLEMGDEQRQYLSDILTEQLGQLLSPPLQPEPVAPTPEPVPEPAPISPAPGSVLAGESVRFEAGLIPPGMHWDFTVHASLDDARSYGQGKGPAPLARTVVMDPSIIHAATLSPLPVDGSDLILLVSWYRIEAGKFSHVQRRPFPYIASTQSVVRSNPNHDFVSGLGALEPLPAAPLPVNEPHVIRDLTGRTIDKLYIRYTGDGEDARALALYNLHDCEIREVVVWFPHEPEYFYLPYKGGRLAAIGVFINDDCTNTTIHKITVYGGTHSVMDRGRGTKVFDSTFYRPARHCLIGAENGPDGDNNIEFHNNILYALPANDRLGGQSMDMINLWRWKRPERGVHRIYENVIMGGGGSITGGVNGSSIVLDGPDPVGNALSGGVRVTGNYSFDPGNKWLGIAQGSDNVASDNTSIQNARSVSRRYSSGGVAAYIADFKSGDGSPSRQFTDNLINRNRVHHYVDSRGVDCIPASHQVNKLTGPLGLVVRETQWAWGTPESADNLISDDNDFAFDGVRSQIISEAATRVAQVPVYGIEGEENLFWINQPD